MIKFISKLVQKKSYPSDFLILNELDQNKMIFRIYFFTDEGNYY
jgi:hypothetical protein